MTKSLQSKTAEEITREFLGKSDEEIASFVTTSEANSDDIYQKSRHDLLSILEANSKKKLGPQSSSATNFSSKIVNRSRKHLLSNSIGSDQRPLRLAEIDKGSSSLAPMKLAAGSKRPNKSIILTNYFLRFESIRIQVWSTVGSQLLLENRHIPDTVSTILIDNFQYDLQVSTTDPRYSHIIGHSYDQLLSQHQFSPINDEIELIVEFL